MKRSRLKLENELISILRDLCNNLYKNRPIVLTKDNFVYHLGKNGGLVFDKGGRLVLEYTKLMHLNHPPLSTIKSIISDLKNKKRG